MIGEPEEQEPKVFTVENCLAVNGLIAELAEAKGMGLIDIYSLFADADGILPPECTGDGIHLTRECYRIWGKWLAAAVGTDTPVEWEEPPAEEEAAAEEEPAAEGEAADG